MHRHAGRTIRALAIVCAIAIAACAVTPAKPAGGTPPTYLLANPAGLVALDASCKALGPIVKLPDQSAPAYPSLHPDGRSVAFGLTMLPNKTTGFGSDIYRVNLDGTDLRPLVEHERENVFYASPRFDPSGTVLYFHRRAAIVEGNQYKGNEDTIERLDLKTGKRDRLITEAADPAISPDGKTLVFVRITGGQVGGLWIANSDGTNPRPFLQTKDTFWYIQAPRFSPLGDTIAFSAAGHSASAVGGGRLAHLGVPSELFLAPLAGNTLRSVGQTGDDVVPAWSPQGDRIAYVGTGGFFIVDIAQQRTDTCAQGQEFFFGDLLWLR